MLQDMKSASDLADSCSMPGFMLANALQVSITFFYVSWIVSKLRTYESATSPVHPPYTQLRSRRGKKIGAGTAASIFEMQCEKRVHFFQAFKRAKQQGEEDMDFTAVYRSMES